MLYKSSAKSKNSLSITHLLSQLIHLLGGQSGVSEHADLAGDMAPVVLRSQCLKLLLQQGAHGDDAVSHTLDLTQPLLVETWVVEHLRGNTSTVNGRVGVKRADKNLDLRVNALLLLRISADDREGADTFTIEALHILITDSKQTQLKTHHVLGEGLRETWVVALLNEISQRKSVLVCVSGGESLVCHVKEGVMLASLDGVADLLPLLRRRINTSGVVCACVQQEDASLGCSLNICQQALEIKTNGVLVIVPVLLDLQTGVLEDGAVVCP